MKMYLYYFTHTAWNQFRRFIRTWAFFMVIVFFTIGGFLAYAVRWYYQRLSTIEALLPEDWMEFFDAGGLTRLDAVELAVGLLILGILVIQIIGAGKTVSRVFLPADVNLLFASDLSPQTVLSFRLISTLALAFVASILLFFQVPLMMKRFGLGLYAAFAIPLAWCLTLGFSILLKILLFEIGSTHPFLHKNLRWFILGFLGILGLLLYLDFRRSEEQMLLLSAHRFFNAPWTRWIPVWGWVKGVLLFALEGDIEKSLLLLALCAVLLALLIFATRRVRADYYEQTLNRTQEIEQLLDGLSQEGVSLLAAKLGRYSHVRQRVGIHFGWGSRAYFFKVLHNRFRFSRTRLLTKTSLTYLFVAVGAGLFDRAFMDEPMIYIPVLVLAAMVFFRTIVSPVAEDIRKASFLLQPDPIWKKLFFSVVGGSCNCALDVLLPLAAGSVAAGFSPLAGLAFAPVLAGVDFFASTAGAFVDVSLPPSIGIAFKQVIQILLLYVGLIFDGMLLVGGITGGHPSAGFVLVTIVNILLGGFFLGLTGVWLYPCSGRPVKSPGYAPDTAGARKMYSRVGFALLAMYAAIHAGQYLLGKIAPDTALIATYLPIYVIGLPIFLLLQGKREEEAAKAQTALNEQTAATEQTAAVARTVTGERTASKVSHTDTSTSASRSRSSNTTQYAKSQYEHALNLWEFLRLIPVCLFAVYAGNLIGQILEALLSLVIPFHLPLPVATLSGDHPVVQAILLVVAAPLMEEFVFRRCVMDRLLPFGERAALKASALLFGLFHSSVSQACYAFTLGIVLGYVYIRTRRLRYTIMLHVLINSLSTIVLPLLLSRFDFSMSQHMMGQNLFSAILQIPGLLPLVIYICLLLVLSLYGGVLFLFGLREHDLSRDGIGPKTACFAPGFLIFVLCTVLWLCLS